MNRSSPVRFSTRVGTRIAPRTPRTSISRFIFVSATAAPGLALRRMTSASAALSSSLEFGAQLLGELA
jgi:hypothetical protein